MRRILLVLATMLAAVLLASGVALAAAIAGDVDAMGGGVDLTAVGWLRGAQATHHNRAPVPPRSARSPAGDAPVSALDGAEGTALRLGELVEHLLEDRATQAVLAVDPDRHLRAEPLLRQRDLDGCLAGPVDPPCQQRAAFALDDLDLFPALAEASRPVAELQLVVEKLPELRGRFDQRS